MHARGDAVVTYKVVIRFGLLCHGLGASCLCGVRLGSLLLANHDSVLIEILSLSLCAGIYWNPSLQEAA